MTNTAPAPVEEAVDALRALRKALDQDVAQKLAELEIPTTGKPQEILKLFAGIDAIAKVADKIAKKAKDEREAINDRTLWALSELGLRNAPIAGGPTVYQKRELWAGIATPDGAEEPDRDGAIEALKAAGLTEYVQEGFNVQSLSAFFRERERDLEEQIREREGLPSDEPVVVDLDELFAGELAPLKGKIKLSEKTSAAAKTA